MTPTEYFMVFLVCLICSGYQAWRIGQKNGIKHSIEWLTENGYLDLEEEPAT